MRDEEEETRRGCDGETRRHEGRMTLTPRLRVTVSLCPFSSFIIHPSTFILSFKRRALLVPKYTYVVEAAFAL